MEVFLDWRFWVGWFQQRDVEHWVDLRILWQLKSKVDWLICLEMKNGPTLTLSSFFRWSSRA